MSNIGTLTIISDPEEIDQLLTQQGGRSGKTEIGLTFDAIYPVGSILLHTTSLTPTERGLQGTWEVIGEDYTLKPVPRGTEGIGELTGNNTRSFPLPAHTHTTTLSYNGAHSHSHQFIIGDRREAILNPENAPAYIAKINTTYVTTNSSGSHSHDVDIHYAPSTFPDVSFNILGRNSKFIIWERVS